MRYKSLGIILISALCFLKTINIAAADELETGEYSASIIGETIELFVYRPENCKPSGFLFVFHGKNRNAYDYRENAEIFAARTCLIAIAPRFDRERFPNWRYHRGGIVFESEVLPEDEWTVDAIGDLVEWANRRNGKQNAPVYLFGHSAGAQFLSRVAAFAQIPNVERIVLANASSYVMPGFQEDAPYGLAELVSAKEQKRLLSTYLKRPVTIYLGQEDTGSRNLHNAPAAKRQGRNRLDRGRKVYAAAVRAARKRGIKLNWKLVEAPDIGHSSRKMLSAPEAMAAFGLEHPRSLPRKTSGNFH